MKEIEWEGKGNITYIKIRTKENMFYTLSKLEWNDLVNDGNSETFGTMEEYVKYVTSKQIQNITNNVDNKLIYLYLENRALNRDDIKEIFVETHKPLKAK